MATEELVATLTALADDVDGNRVSLTDMLRIALPLCTFNFRLNKESKNLVNMKCNAVSVH